MRAGAAVLPILLLILSAVIASVAVTVFICLRVSKKKLLPIRELCQSMLTLQPPQTTEDHDCIEINQLYEAYRFILTETQQQIKIREEAAARLRQAEHYAFQSRINRHFICDTLESINALAAAGNSTDASAMAAGLSTCLRSSLDDDTLLIPLKQEIQQAVSYFRIQQLRYPGRISLELDLPPVLPEHRIVKLILQPFIENSIVHGFKDIDYPGIITLSVAVTSETLTIRVADNGRGCDITALNSLLNVPSPDREDQENKIGFYCIRNVCRRLKSCYGQHFTIHYEENSLGGITVWMSFEILALNIIAGCLENI